MIKRIRRIKINEVIINPNKVGPFIVITLGMIIETNAYDHGDETIKKITPIAIAADHI